SRPASPQTDGRTSGPSRPVAAPYLSYSLPRPRRPHTTRHTTSPNLAQGSTRLPDRHASSKKTVRFSFFPSARPSNLWLFRPSEIPSVVAGRRFESADCAVHGRGERD